jgi:hypothetical protein
MKSTNNPHQHYVKEILDGVLTGNLAKHYGDANNLDKIDRPIREQFGDRNPFFVNDLRNRVRMSYGEEAARRVVKPDLVLHANPDVLEVAFRFRSEESPESPELKNDQNTLHKFLDNANRLSETFIKTIAEISGDVGRSIYRDVIKATDAISSLAKEAGIYTHHVKPLLEETLTRAQRMFANEYIDSTDEQLTELAADFLGRKNSKSGSGDAANDTSCLDPRDLTRPIKAIYEALRSINEVVGGVNILEHLKTLSGLADLRESLYNSHAVNLVSPQESEQYSHA